MDWSHLDNRLPLPKKDAGKCAALCKKSYIISFPMKCDLWKAHFHWIVDRGVRLTLFNVRVNIAKVGIICWNSNLTGTITHNPPPCRGHKSRFAHPGGTCHLLRMRSHNFVLLWQGSNHLYLKRKIKTVEIYFSRMCCTTDIMYGPSSSHNTHWQRADTHCAGMGSKTHFGYQSKFLQNMLVWCQNPKFILLPVAAQCG